MIIYSLPTSCAASPTKEVATTQPPLLATGGVVQSLNNWPSLSPRLLLKKGKKMFRASLRIVARLAESGTAAGKGAIRCSASGGDG